MIDLTAAYLKENFPELKDDQLRQDIATHGQLHSFPTDVIVLKEAQYLDHIPLVIKGGVKVVRHSDSRQRIFL